MNDEIKEILDNFSKAYDIHKEIISKHNNADEIHIEISLKESKQLLDYITNLQSKIEAYELFDNQKITNLQEENDKLQERIDKAIAYIDKELSFNVIINGKENKVIAYNKAFENIRNILESSDEQ